jgi:hypothetical protein
VREREGGREACARRYELHTDVALGTCPNSLQMLYVRVCVCVRGGGGRHGVDDPYVYMRTHTQTERHTHPCVHPRTRTHTYTHTLSLSLSLSHTHTHSLSLSLSLSLTHSLSLTPSFTLSLTLSLCLLGECRYQGSDKRWTLGYEQAFVAYVSDIITNLDKKCVLGPPPHTHTRRHTERDRQTDTERERRTDRHTERERDRESGCVCVHTPNCVYALYALTDMCRAYCVADRVRIGKERLAKPMSDSVRAWLPSPTPPAE